MIRSKILPFAGIMAAVMAAGWTELNVNAAEQPAAPAPAAAAGDRGGGRFGGFQLTETQRQLLRQAYEANQEEFNKLNEKIREAETALREAVFAEPYDASAVKEKVDALTKLQGELLTLQLKAFSTVIPSMTAEQKERYKNLPVRMLGFMVGGGMDRGGRGPGGFGAGGFGGRDGGPGGPPGGGRGPGGFGGRRGGDRGARDGWEQPPR